MKLPCVKTDCSTYLIKGAEPENHVQVIHVLCVSGGHMILVDELAHVYTCGWLHTGTLLKSENIHPIAATKLGRLLAWRFTGNSFPVWICVQPPRGTTLSYIPAPWKQPSVEEGWHYATIATDQHELTNKISIAVRVLGIGTLATAINSESPRDLLELIPHSFEEHGLLWAHEQLMQAEAAYKGAELSWDKMVRCRIDELEGMSWPDFRSFAKQQGARVGGATSRKETARTIAWNENPPPIKHEFVLAWLQEHAPDAIHFLIEEKE